VILLLVLSEVLEVSSGALLLAVTIVGVVIFFLVTVMRLRPLFHQPRIVRRVDTKPTAFASVVPVSLGGPPISGGVPSTPSSGTEVGSREELLAAKARWEDLIREAESNETLTSEQRQSFVDEARRSIREIEERFAKVS
jgi:hypothetical protein